MEMVEPDRTIMIVSIVGLVIIWGSVAYHKFVQGGGGGSAEAGPVAETVESDPVEDSAGSAGGGRSSDSGQQFGEKRKKRGKSAGKKRKRKG